MGSDPQEIMELAMCGFGIFENRPLRMYNGCFECFSVFSIIMNVVSIIELTVYIYTLDGWIFDLCVSKYGFVCM